jgi:hypothetical protein
MANLTGQAIQNTYPGLLNLATATTGVTSTPQQIQDGLGNNTGTRIGTNFLTNPMVFGMADYKADYYGVGFTATGVAPVASTQNILIGNLFYDNGTYDYSAITYNLSTATTTSDVVTIAFYSTQYVDGVGVAPSVLIQSGITLSSTAPLGVKTTSLPSALSFSGFGPGYYFMMMRISNAGVTPTVRYTGSGNALITAGVPIAKLGFTLTPAGTAAQLPTKSVGGTTQIAYSGLTNFQTSFSTTDVRTFSSTVTPPGYGFTLNTIK